MLSQFNNVGVPPKLLKEYTHSLDELETAREVMDTILKL